MVFDLWKGVKSGWNLLVSRRVHFGHEAELANGEGVGEDDVGAGQEGGRKCGALGWPHVPIDTGKTAGGLTSLDACSDDGDANGDDYRG